MKKFLNVSVKNFFSFGPQEQTLQLDGKGVININAPNGFGKTTMCIEAMTFGIYGKTRQDKIDDCVNRSIGQDAKVSIEFLGDDDEVYKIIRYRKHTTHNNAVYLFKGDKDISCKNNKDTDALIQDYVGMPYLAFVNSTIFSSELYSNFLSAKNSERLVIFENILSLKEVNAFYAENKNILKEIGDKEESAKIDLSGKSAEANAIKTNIEGYTNNARSKLLSLKQEKETAKFNKEKLEKELSELNEISEEELEQEKSKLSNIKLKEQLENQLNYVENNKPKDPSDGIIPEDLKAKKSKLDNFDFDENGRKEEEAKEIDKQYVELENEIKIKENEVKSLHEKMASSDYRLKELNSKKDQLNKDLEKIKDSICPYCGQKMNEEETKEKKSSILEKISELEKEEKDFCEESIELANNYEASSNLVKELKEKFNNKPIIEFVPNNDLLKQEYETLCKDIENLDKGIAEYNKKNSEYKLEKQKIEDQISKIELPKYSEEFLNNFEAKINSLKEEIKNCDNEIAKVDSTVHSVYDKNYVEQLNKDLKEKEAIAEEAKKILKEISDERVYYEFLGECFSNKSGGFKKYFIGEMIELFNQKVNQFLPFFFNEKVEIEFDRDLVETIKFAGDTVSFSSFSRGQKCRAEIAVAFALFSVSRVFFSNESGLLVVDELLDNGLDVFGIKSAISVLESFAEDSRVFVVSHNPDVKDNIDEVIEIKRDENNFSYIVE